MKQIKITIWGISILLFFLLLGSPLLINTNSKMAFATNSSDNNKCNDAAKKISKNADGHASGNVCEIGLSRDSPIIMLSAKQGVSNEKINELTSMEYKYQPSSASSTNKVWMLAEFQLKQTEVNNVQKTLLNNGWMVTAIHNHELLENPLMIYLHAQKSDNLNNILKDVKDVLSKTDCKCT